MRTTLKVSLLFLGLALLSGCKAYNCGCPMSSLSEKNTPWTEPLRDF